MGNISNLVIIIVYWHRFTHVHVFDMRHFRSFCESEILFKANGRCGMGKHSGRWSTRREKKKKKQFKNWRVIQTETLELKIRGFFLVSQG